ncbi:MAG: energy-coupling factor transporter ATPase [Christensenellaceae bacterium]|nr:energy-coupling factor transporter ATPase [Christensenellaceae bacterium]
MEKIIESKDLGYIYESNESSHRALENVNIDVKEGEFVVILGHNGSGKSTLARHINALLIPSEGKMLTNGMDTSVEDLTLDIRRSAGMVFQNPDNQIVATIVEEDVAFGPENLGVEPEEIIKRVDNALTLVNMKDFAHRSPHMLSGGQKQRVAIAGVLAMNPKIIVFDESTSMLDPVGRQEVMATMQYLNKEEKKTIVLITHFMEETIDADRVIVMVGGKVEAEGKPEEIFAQRDLLERAGLVPPFSVDMANRLRDEGFEIDQTLRSEELVEEICRLLQKN